MCVCVGTTACGCGSWSCLRELRTAARHVPTCPTRLHCTTKAATRSRQQVCIWDGKEFMLVFTAVSFPLLPVGKQEPHMNHKLIAHPQKTI